MARTTIEGGELQALYRQDRDRLVGLAHWVVGQRGLAEELVQDTFAHLIERSPTLDDPDALAAYVRTAVIRRSRSRVRRLVLERRHATAEPEAFTEPDVDDRVRRAVASLPRRQRECVVLRYYADLTVEAIATDLGIGAGSVKTHLHRATATLERLLTEGDLS